MGENVPISRKDNIDDSPKLTNKKKRQKSRDDRKNHRLKKLSRPRANCYKDNGFPPTPLESNGGFVMPTSRENYYSDELSPQENYYSGQFAPVLTPPVSPAISSPRQPNGQAFVTYTALSLGKRSCAYENREPDPSPDVIDRLVSQHFQNCGLGGYVNSPVNQSYLQPPRQVNHKIDSDYPFYIVSLVIERISMIGGSRYFVHLEAVYMRQAIPSIGAIIVFFSTNDLSPARTDNSVLALI